MEDQEEQEKKKREEENLLHHKDDLYCILYYVNKLVLLSQVVLLARIHMQTAGLYIEVWVCEGGRCESGERVQFKVVREPQSKVAKGEMFSDDDDDVMEEPMNSPYFCVQCV